MGEGLVGEGDVPVPEVVPEVEWVEPVVAVPAEGVLVGALAAGELGALVGAPVGALVAPLTVMEC